MLYLFLILTLLSAFGMIFLLVKRMNETRAADLEMVKSGMPAGDNASGTVNSVVNAQSGVALFVKKTWREKLFPRILKLLEIITHGFRLLVLKVERKLFHLTDYIRGKREMHENKEESPYWEEVKNAGKK